VLSEPQRKPCEGVSTPGSRKEVSTLTDRIRFITHQSKQILLVDLSNCSGSEVSKIFQAVPELVIDSTT
jgi:hypothetical protein